MWYNNIAQTSFGGLVGFLFSQMFIYYIRQQLSFLLYTTKLVTS